MNGNDATVFNLTQHTHNSVIKVAILGAESTGKTTLSRDLATHFDSLWVPEYMRIYLQKKWDNEQVTCTWNDLLPIAQGQINLENRLAQQAAQDFQPSRNPNPNPETQKYLFCDTSLFELMVYSNRYYGDSPTALTHAALAHHYDLILLTAIDIPWVADDLRDSPYEREEISAYFETQLNSYDKMFQPIGGSRDERVQQVARWLKELNN